MSQLKHTFFDIHITHSHNTIGKLNTELVVSKGFDTFESLKQGKKIQVENLLFILFSNLSGNPQNFVDLCQVANKC